MPGLPRREEMAPIRPPGACTAPFRYRQAQPCSPRPSATASRKSSSTPVAQLVASLAQQVNIPPRGLTGRPRRLTASQYPLRRPPRCRATTTPAQSPITPASVTCECWVRPYHAPVPVVRAPFERIPPRLPPAIRSPGPTARPRVHSGPSSTKRHHRGSACTSRRPRWMDVHRGRGVRPLWTRDRSGARACGSRRPAGRSFEGARNYWKRERGRGGPHSQVDARG